ncbi:MAG: chemotaxis protein CheW [Deltaproteobacteria bacterium]
MQHIGFKLNDKEYTIPILKVREVIKSPTLTKLPLVPHYVEGVTNLKGRVLAVVNLKKLVGLEGKSLGDNIMVVGSDHIRFGFFVDSITGILNIDESQFFSPSQIKQLGCSIQISNRYVTMLDAKSLIPAEDLDGSGGKLFLDPDDPVNG